MTRQPTSPGRRDFLSRLSAVLLALPLYATHVLRQGARAATRTRAPRLDAKDQQLLSILCRRLVPLPGLSETTVAAILAALEKAAAASTRTEHTLRAGLAAARVHLGPQPEKVPVAKIDEYLGSIAAGPFFASLLKTTLPMAINDHAVWRLAGYQGESLSKGGYLRRGFNDLDWLPAPPPGVMGPIP